MSLKIIETISFFDISADQEAVVIVRSIDQQIGLCISLLQDGDIETFLPVAKAKSVVEAIQKAVAVAEKDIST